MKRINLMRFIKNNTNHGGIMSNKMYSILHPTNQQLNKILELITQQYKKPVHEIIGVSERALRRWRSGEDNSLSKIPASASLALHSIIKGSLITNNYNDLKDKIPLDLMSSSNYKCPPVYFLKALIGRNNILKMTIKEVARKIAYSPIQLGADIKKEKVTYITYCLLLMLAGYKPCEVFNLTE